MLSIGIFQGITFSSHQILALPLKRYKIIPFLPHQNHTMPFLSQFDTIDLSAPWLFHLRHIHNQFIKTGNTPLYEWLNDYFKHQNINLLNHKNYPLTFTHQNDLEHGTAYEAHIGIHHKIPTRDNLHDWFGACIWSAFPKTKSLLNAKHLHHINENHTNNKRNRVRDTITVFDENGAVLVVADDEIGHKIATGLQNFDWQTCLVANRQYWDNYTTFHQNDKSKAKIFIFGHALLEQLINPYKSLCSHTFIIRVNPSFFNLPIDKQLTILDNKLAIEMDKFLSDTVTPRNLNPLPILGVPYFWENDNPKFYDDTFVFRNGRRKR